MSELSFLLETLGEDLTLKMVEAFGGTRCHVPEEKIETHRLREVLGDAGFALLRKHAAGDQIKVPLAKRWRLEVYAKRGLQTAEIARRVGYDERSVARIRNGNGNMSAQLSLLLDNRSS
jgi:hypothetical protein